MAKRDQETKPKGKSKYAAKQITPIEATHPHNPPCAWCPKCRAK